MNLRSTLFPVIFLAIITSSSFGTTIGDAKKLNNNDKVFLSGKVVTSGYGEIGAQLYIEEPDRSAGIQVAINSQSLPDAVEGAIVDVRGTIYTNVLNEKFIKNPTVNVTGSMTPLNPFFITNSRIGGGQFGNQPAINGGIGLNNVGLLVTSYGLVSNVDPTGNYVDINDGTSNRIRIDTSRLSPGPLAGDFILTTGVVSTTTGDASTPISQIKPRVQNDVVSITPNVENLMKIQTPGGKVSAIWIGQAGFILQDQYGNRLVIDPYLSNYAALNPPNVSWNRMLPIPIDPTLVQPGLTLLTHDHNDHTDPWTLNPINTSSQSLFWGPTSVYNHLLASDIDVSPSRAMVINRGQTATWNGIQITAVYSNHTADSVGYVLNIAGKKIYISGDTLYDQTLVNTVTAQHPDIMMVCINGLYGNMTYDQAASLVKACSPQIAIPMHYGMFSINTTDPQNFVNSCVSQGVTAKVLVMKFGGYLVF